MPLNKEEFRKKLWEKLQEDDGVDQVINTVLPDYEKSWDPVNQMWIFKEIGTFDPTGEKVQIMTDRYTHYNEYINLAKAQNSNPIMHFDEDFYPHYKLLLVRHKFNGNS